MEFVVAEVLRRVVEVLEASGLVSVEEGILDIVVVLVVASVVMVVVAAVAVADVVLLVRRFQRELWDLRDS